MPEAPNDDRPQTATRPPEAAGTASGDARALQNGNPAIGAPPERPPGIRPVGLRPARPFQATAPRDGDRDRPDGRPSPQAPHGRSDAGAVLRRRPPEVPAGTHPRDGVPRPVGGLAPIRRPPSIVDAPDGRRPADGHPLGGQGGGRGAPGRPAGSIVDTPDGAGLAAGHPRGAIVDNADGGGARPRRPGGVIVDAPDAMPGFTTLVDPRNGRATLDAPSGPSESRVRRVREARKENLATRARKRGVDPGAGSTPSSNGMTRSEKTHAQYLDRGDMLIRRYRREAGLGSGGMDDVDPVEFVNWLISLKPTLARATWRPYRQAAKAILAPMPHDNVDAAIAMIDADIAESVADGEAVSRTGKAPATRAEGLPRRTSALKEKRFPKADFDKVLGYLRHFSRSGFAPVLADWMVAGVSTGLRPIEWQATELEIREDPAAPNGRWVWLYVLNAKATNNRGNGLVRTLNLSSFSDAALGAVSRMSARGAEWLDGGEYHSMQSQVSQLLYAVCERLPQVKRTYALYSLRHQFVANVKTYHRNEAVAALCGHVVAETSTESYAKKASSWGPEEISERPEPVAEEVSTVRQRLRFFEERIRLQQEAGLIKGPKP